MTFFPPAETSCKCGCGFDIRPQLRTALDELRTAFGAPLLVVSGRRCLEHNSKVGGAINSLHLVGLAADIRLPSTLADRARLYKLIHSGPWSGVGYYTNFVHVDLRLLHGMRAARWIGE